MRSGWPWVVLLARCALALVSPDASMIYGSALQGAWTAGQMITFYVQLTDDSGGNASTTFAAPLVIDCVSNDETQQASFCAQRPVLSLVGPGNYMATLQVGRFSASSAVVVMYNGTHLPGSPIRPVLVPAEASRLASYVVQRADTLQATRGTVEVGRLHLRDDFNNLIDESAGANITWELTAAAHFVLTSFMWIDAAAIKLMVTNATTAGDFQYAVYIINTLGYRDIVRVQVAGGFSDYGSFCVRPKQFAKVYADAHGASVSAGSEHVYRVHVTDEFDNAAVLAADYVFFKRPYYAISEQNVELVQVTCEQAGCFSIQPCCQPEINVTMSSIAFGTIQIGINATAAGTYVTTVLLQGGTLTWHGQHTVSPSVQASLANSALDVGTKFSAGEVVPFHVQVRDRYANQIQWTSSLVQIVLLCPNGSTMLHSVPDVGNSFELMHTKSGNYTADLVINAVEQARPVTYQVAPGARSSPYWTNVSGLGLGVAIDGANVIMAGLMYEIRVVGQDRFGNAQAGAPGFVLGAGFAANCTYVAYANTATDTTVTYAIQTAGKYSIEIVNPWADVILEHSILVSSYPRVGRVVVQGLTATDSTIMAGETKRIYVLAADQYNNTLLDAKAVMRLVQGATAASSTHTPVAVFPNGTHSFLLTAQASGPARLVVHMPTYNFTSELAFQVTAAAIRPASSFLRGFTVASADTTATVSIALRDGSGNQVPAQGNISQEIDILTAPACDCAFQAYYSLDCIVLSTRIANPGMYSLYVTIRNQSLATYPYSLLVIPDARQVQCNESVATRKLAEKIGRRFGGLVAAVSVVFSVAAGTCCALSFLFTAAKSANQDLQT